MRRFKLKGHGRERPFLREDNVYLRELASLVCLRGRAALGLILMYLLALSPGCLGLGMALSHPSLSLKGNVGTDRAVRTTEIEGDRFAFRKYVGRTTPTYIVEGRSNGFIIHREDGSRIRVEGDILDSRTIAIVSDNRRAFALFEGKTEQALPDEILAPDTGIMAHRKSSTPFHPIFMAGEGDTAIIRQVRVYGEGNFRLFSAESLDTAYLARRLFESEAHSSETALALDDTQLRREKYFQWYLASALPAVLIGLALASLGTLRRMHRLSLLGSQLGLTPLFAHSSSLLRLQQCIFSRLARPLLIIPSALLLSIAIAGLPTFGWLYPDDYFLPYMRGVMEGRFILNSWILAILLCTSLYALVLHSDIDRLCGSRILLLFRNYPGIAIRTIAAIFFSVFALAWWLSFVAYLQRFSVQLPQARHVHFVRHIQYEELLLALTISWLAGLPILLLLATVISPWRRYGWEAGSKRVRLPIRSSSQPNSLDPPAPPGATLFPS